MAKKSSVNRKSTEQTAEADKKRIIGIAIGIVVVIVIAIAYLVWPKSAAPIAPTETSTTNTSSSTGTTRVKIEDLVVGTGKQAEKGDRLVVDYTGWTQEKYASNEPFDKSSIHEQPFQFVLGTQEAIEGWNQGLLGMKVGGKRKITVPPDLGYGASGAADGRIPPNATLVFEIELLDLQKAIPTLPPSSVTELKIEDLVVGTGAAAKNGDTLSVHYTGWLENGTKFDTSIGGDPIEFVLGQGRVIAGWEQGLLGMKVGGKRRLTIPASLGYGEYGGGDSIPPNATLIFEVELVAIK